MIKAGIAIAFLTLSFGVFAGGSSNSSECGHACIYEQANENLSVQYLYVRRKIEFLESQVDPPNNASQADAYEEKVERLQEEKRKVLGNFCLKEPIPELLSDCIVRFKGTSDLWLAKLRVSLAKNESSQNKLFSENDGIKSVPRSDPAPGRVPNPPTSEELGAMNSAVDPSTVKGKGFFEPLEPRPEDYVAFDTINRDPNDPSKGVFVVPKTKNGQHVLDDKAYQAALASWRGYVNPALAAKEKEEFKLGDQIKEDQAKFKKDFAPGIKGDARSTSRKIYDDARGFYVEYVNAGGQTPKDRVANSFAPVQNFPAQPAGAADPQAGAGGARSPSQYIPGHYSGTENTTVQAGHQTSVRVTADQIHFSDPTWDAPSGVAQPAAHGTASPSANPNPVSGPNPPYKQVAPNPYSGNAMGMDQYLGTPP